LIKAFGNFLGVVLGLTLLVAFLAGGYFLFRYIVEVFGELDPAVATLTAIASVVALLCAAIIANGLRGRGQKHQETSIRADKAALYEQLLTLWGERLKRQERKDDPVAEDELLKLEQLLALRGNPNVIKSYVHLQRLVRQEGVDSDGIPALRNKLLMEMRKDLGQNTLNLSDKDVLELLCARH